MNPRHILGRVGLSALLGLTLAAPAAVQAEPSSAIQTAIQQCYARSSRAVGFKYVDGVLSIRADDFVGYVATGQRINPQAEVRSLINLFEKATKITDTQTVQLCVPSGDRQARVRVREEMILLFPAKDLVEARTPMSVISTYDDVWVKQGTEWKLKMSRLLSQQVSQGQNLQM